MRLIISKNILSNQISNISSHRYISFLTLNDYFLIKNYEIIINNTYNLLDNKSDHYDLIKYIYNKSNFKKYTPADVSHDEDDSENGDDYSDEYDSGEDEDKDDYYLYGKYQIIINYLRNYYKDNNFSNNFFL